MTADEARLLYVERLANYMGSRLLVEPSDILGARRGAVHVTAARQLIMYWLRDRLHWEVQAIGDALGRDHSTVSTGVFRMRRCLPGDSELTEALRSMPRWYEQQFTSGDLVTLYQRLRHHLDQADAVKAELDAALLQQDIPQRALRAIS